MTPDPAAVRELFPEIERIESQDLQEETVDVWTEALDRGGWSVDDVSRIPASLHLVGLGIGLAEHTRAVTRVVRTTAETYRQYYPADTHDLNLDHLTAAGLLHDVGKVLEYDETGEGWEKSAEGEYVRHPFSGVALCDRYGVPHEVQHMIAFHSREGDAYERTPGATILHYADYLNFDPLR
jgi:putative nucleotidyltransferase with HDIG domain